MDTINKSKILTMEKSERKKKIEKLLKQGFTQAEIAKKLGIFRSTVFFNTPKGDKWKKEWRKSKKHREYLKKARDTDEYREYSKHLYHIKVNKKFSNCKKCK